VKGVHCVTLQERNLDWLAVLTMEHASALAEHVDWADTRTTGAKNICVENAQGGTAQITGGDSLDEPGHIDVCGAGSGAGRIEAVEAAVGLNDSGLGCERRLQFAEAFAQKRVVR
jgi:hypothetical protein